MPFPSTIVSVLCIILLLAAPSSVSAQAPDTLIVFDAAIETPGGLPAGWDHVLPDDQVIYTTYVIERSIDGNYLRARSAASSSYLEYDLGEVEPSEFPVLVWEWKVDQFPETEWEQNEPHDDFAMRIELVFDYHGSWKNPLNIIRKGLFTTIFKRYPPDRIISYVWSVNVPSQEPYTSPSADRITIIPVESNNVIKGRWMRERLDFRDDIERLTPRKQLVLKKIRIHTDTESSGSMADSGLKYLYLISDHAQ